MKILVVQTASIGDVILSTALLEKLHGYYPAGEIDILLQKGSDCLFKEHPYIRRLYVWDKKKQKITNMHRIIREIRKERYDYVINVQRFATTGWICLRSNAKHTIGFDKNPFSLFYTTSIAHEISSKKYIYELDRNQKLIEQITDNKAAETKLYPSFKDYDSVEAYKEMDYISISPSSLWFTKQYPAKKWIELIHGIHKDTRIYLLGSSSDYSLCENIKTECPENDIRNLAGTLTLLQSAALMKDAVMNFTNDSAPLHLAVSVKAKVTAIFCSTVKEFGFAPKGENIKIVETTEKLTCRPCGLHGRRKCPEKHFRCALNINTNELLKNINYEP